MKCIKVKKMQKTWQYRKYIVKPENMKVIENLKIDKHTRKKLRINKIQTS